MKKLFVLLAFTGMVGAASAATVATAFHGTAIVLKGDDKKGDDKKKAEKKDDKACCKKGDGKACCSHDKDGKTESKAKTEGASSTATTDKK